MPVARGIAVVDPVARTVRRKVTLPVTPSDAWVAPATGRLFATLPGADRVAVLDTGVPGAVPRLVNAGAAGRCRRYVGLLRSVVVVGVDGTVTRLDARSGRRVDARRIAVLGPPAPAPLVLRRVRSTRSGDALSLVLALGGGRLDETSIVVRDGTLSDGKAVFEIWQGGIRSRIRSRTVDGVTLRVGSEAGRLRLTLTASRGLYERLRIGRDGPRTVEATMRRVTPPASGQRDARRRRHGADRRGGGTTPPPPPPPPPGSPYDIG